MGRRRWAARHTNARRTNAPHGNARRASTVLALTLCAAASALGLAGAAMALEPTANLASTVEPPASLTPAFELSASLSSTLEASASLTPVLSVTGQTVQWKAIAGETNYIVAVSNLPRGTAGRTTQYLTIPRLSSEPQAYTPTLQPGQTVYVGVSADKGATWSSEEAKVTAPAPEEAPTAPVLSVSGQTVQWKALASETYYVIAVSNLPRGTTGRTTKYLTLLRKATEPQAYTPTLEPGQTAYVGVSADSGKTWSTTEATVTAPTPTPPPPKEEPAPEEPAPAPEEPAPAPAPEEAPTAPVLSVSGQTVQWKALASETYYVIAVSNLPRGTTGRTTKYLTLLRKATEPQAYTPTLEPGQTAYVGVSADSGKTWSTTEATVTAPTPTPPPPKEEPAPEEPAPAPEEAPLPLPTGKIVGTNDGAGWGEAAAKTILAGHITWNRVEIGTKTNTLPTSLLDGFRVLAIVRNVGDSTPLSQIEPNQWGNEVASQIAANPGMAIAEAGNEMYYKGGVANPVQYGKMYLAAVNAMKAAGIHVPLLFNMWGDYPYGSWSSPTGWSQDASGGGWLHDAVAGVPGLAAAILANGVSTHPYGALTQSYADEEGVAAVAAQEAVAQRVLGSVPPFYVTEFGYALDKCGAPDGACSQAEQASKAKSAYEALLADAHVKGIWWYQSHDDSTGAWGYMNNDNTTRPSFSVLSSLAKTQGQ